MNMRPESHVRRMRTRDVELIVASIFQKYDFSTKILHIWSRPRSNVWYVSSHIGSEIPEIIFLENTRRDESAGAPRGRHHRQKSTFSSKVNNIVQSQHFNRQKSTLSSSKVNTLTMMPSTSPAPKGVCRLTARYLESRPLMRRVGHLRIHRVENSPGGVVQGYEISP